MRTFRVAPSNPGHDVHHAWLLIATEEDGSEVTIETYGTMAEAEAARAVLAREETDLPP